MLLSDYYLILGLSTDASVDEIKRAYRQKARLYHPDINHSPDAMEMFIKVTKAYDFLMSCRKKEGLDEEAFNKVMEEWKKYRQEKSARRANIYARTSYRHFTNTKFYRSTRILNGTSIIFTFAISVLVLVFTVYGYLFRLKHPVEVNEKPPVLSFIILLILSSILLTGSFIYLKTYIDSSDKNKRKTG